MSYNAPKEADPDPREDTESKAARPAPSSAPLLASDREKELTRRLLLHASWLIPAITVLPTVPFTAQPLAGSVHYDYVGFSDVGHGDLAGHYDIDHRDDGGLGHGDEGHGDGVGFGDNLHEDSVWDHVDITIGDEHQDQLNRHTDVGPYDITHSDSPHGDSGGGGGAHADVPHGDNPNHGDSPPHMDTSAHYDAFS